jgi:alkylated DNA nucleotide flippase Atl1
MSIPDQAHRAVPILVEIAENPQTVVYGRYAGKITYGDLAKLVGGSPRSMGEVCGYIRDKITKPHKLPYLNSLVVNAKGYPTEIDYGDTPEDAKRNFPQRSQAVYAYKEWRPLMRKLSLG